MKRSRFFFWLVAGPVAIVATMLAAAHPFLAVTERSGGDVLVVEGWMPEEQLREVPRWVDSLHYLTLEGLLSCVKREPSSYCTACYSGEYRLDPEHPVTDEVAGPQMTMF